MAITVDFVCQQCGKAKSAKVYPSKKTPKYCSRVCLVRANGQAAHARALRSVPCQHCGKTISFTGAKAPKHCSRACYAVSQAKSERPFRVDETTGCWVWQRARHRNGYGKLWDGTRAALAHRVMFERANGPIPDGMVLDHRCDNRACVNPDHLEVKTNAGNLRRTVRSRLTAADVAEIKRLAGTMQQKDIALRFGVNRHHVSNILAGRGWTGE